MTRPPAHTNADPDAHVDILRAAFTGDPLFSWVFPGADHVANLGSWWEFIVAGAAGLSHDGRAELWTIDDGAAAAIWYAPRFDHADADADADADAEDEDDADEPNPFVEMIAGLVSDRVGEVLAGFGRINEAHPTEPHWYLPAVGTRPSHQGQGSGARLLQPVLDRCDEQGLGAYLESSNARNVPFYHRLGFEITAEIVVEEPTLDSPGAIATGMWRRPRP